MTALPPAAGSLIQWTVERLLTGSVQGVLVIGIVWLVCRRVAAVPASARALLWWLASLKLLLALLPLPALPLALLTPQERALVELPGPTSPAREALRRTGRGTRPAPDAASPAVGTTPRVAARHEQEGPVDQRRAGALDVRPWVAVVMALWLTGLMVQAGRLLRTLRRVRGVASRSVALATEDAAIVRRIADDVGLSVLPAIRVSDEIDSPQVVGVRRPIVLLPTAVITGFTPNELAMTLCHELVHVRRHDLAFGWVPALAERLFFFHPLARLTAREYVLAREAACDAAVLRALGVAPQEYGRLLLRFGVTRFESRFAATGASPSTSSLRRRLDMLHHDTLGRASRRATWLLGSAVALCLLPFQLVARTPAEPVSAAPEVTAPASGRDTDLPVEGGPEGAPLRDVTLRDVTRDSVIGDAAVPQEPATPGTSAMVLQSSSEAELLDRLIDVEQLDRAPLQTLERQRQALEEQIEETIAEREALRELLPDANALLHELAEQGGQAIDEQIQRRAIEALRQAVETQIAVVREAADRVSKAQARDQEPRAMIAEELARRARQQATDNSQEQERGDTLRFLEAQLREAQDGLRAPRLVEQERLVRELEAKIETIRQQRESPQSQERLRLRDTERRADRQISSLEQQIDLLTRAQQQLERQLRAMAEQQETIAAAQRQLSSQAARILEAVEKAANAIHQQGERDRVPNAK